MNNNRFNLQEMLQREQTIDQILDLTEEKLNGKPTKDEFNRDFIIEQIFANGDCSVTYIHFINKGVSFPKHEHLGEVEFTLGIKGKGVITIDGISRILRTGECVSIPKGVIHSGYSLEPDSKIMVINVPEDKNIKKLLESLKIDA